MEERGKIATSEFPLKGLRNRFVVGLESQQSVLDGGQRREVVGGKDLALDDGEVDLDLIEPTGMNGTMHRNQSWKFLLQSGNASRPTMRGAVVHDPEDPARLVVRCLLHDLVDQSLERRDASLALAAAKHFGAVDIEDGQVGPSAAALVFVLDAHGHAGLGRQRRVRTRARLNAGFLVGGQHELVITQHLPLPPPLVKIEDASSLDGKLGIAREDPAAVLPRPNRIRIEPAPDGAVADGSDQPELPRLLRHVGHTEAR